LLVKLVSAVAAIVLGFLGVAMDEWSGQTPPTRSLDVYMAPNWKVGEARICAAYQRNSPEVGFLVCPVMDSVPEPQKTEVQLWGRVSRPEIYFGQVSGDGRFRWQCVRRKQRLVCYALD
jgi:hypothetical protein